MTRPLPHSFFDRPTVRVARDLIGCMLVRKIGTKIEKYVITETEAYDGHNDLASHASRGMTERNAVMFGPAGYWYVYFIYGVHWMLNITTGPKGYPAAVLIRGIEKARGPGRLTKKIHITGALTKKAASKKSGLWIEARPKPISSSRIKKSVRIGIDYAGPIWTKKEWRFTFGKIDKKD